MCALDTRQDSLVVELLRARRAGLVAVYRFGSTVDGFATADSDLDVAVLTAEPLSADMWFAWQEQLTERLGTAVDLLDLSTASPVLAVQVITRGRLLHDADPLVRGRFEDQALAAYAWLNEERREILAQIAAEGTVYGR